MSKSAEILRARSYYYEFFGAPFFFSETSEKFEIWQAQLKELAKNPLNEACEGAFKNLARFDFTKFKTEQNSVLFDLSYVNVPLSASFYEEGRDEGAARLRVIEILKKSPYRRDAIKCPSSEDFVGFIFLIMATLLRDEIDEVSEISLSSELFSRVINLFIDEFNGLLASHKQADFFKNLAILLENFIALERSLLALSAPKRDLNKPSPAQIALNKQPYQTKMPTANTKLNLEEFSLAD